MRDAIEPVALARRRYRRRKLANVRALLAVIILLPVLSAACRGALPDRSASPPATSPSLSASPSAPASTPSNAGASATPTGDVFIGLVELAAEDPSPGGTYIAIENRSATPADIGCWRLSTTTREDLRILAGSTVPAGGALRLFFERGDVANPDRLELRDNTGRVVDATPVLDDNAADDQLFGRVGGEWVLGRPPLPSPLVDGGVIGPGGC